MELDKDQRRKICGHLEFAISRLQDLKRSAIPSREALDDVDVLDSALLKLQGAGESLYGVERAANPGRAPGSKDPHYLDVQYPDTEWKYPRSVRNIVSHAYVTIDNDIIWEVIQNHADALIQAIERVIADHQP